MSRVEINAGDRHIIVDHDGELHQLTSEAFDLWTKTHTPSTALGLGSAGFQADRRGTYDVARTPEVRA